MNPGSTRSPEDPIRRGLFITVEGIDGAGKSSHLPWMAQWWRDRGHRVVSTREPGGTDLAEQIRDLLLHRPMDLETELLLVFAARQDHLRQTIRPALARGDVVICDRFTDSTYAYQGGGRGADQRWIDALAQRVHPDLVPDRTYLFDLPAVVAAGRRAAVRPADRFEAEDVAFFERVRAAYQMAARRAGLRFRVIDGTGTPDQVRVILEEDLRVLNQHLTANS